MLYISISIRSRCSEIIMLYCVIFTVHKLRNVTFIVVEFDIVMFILIPILNENLFLNFRFSYELLLFFRSLLTTQYTAILFYTIFIFYSDIHSNFVIVF